MEHNGDTRVTEAIETHKTMVQRLQREDLDTITEAAECIVQALRRGNRIYVCGNGGSAADAQHIAGEFVGRFKRERKAFPAIALSTDTSVLTCIANDYSFEEVFARQVEALVCEADVLWAFSTSGSSANVVRAVEVAKEKGAQILAFTGKAGSRLEKLADICPCADNPSTARSQEIHQLAYHIICDLVEASLCES